MDMNDIRLCCSYLLCIVFQKFWMPSFFITHCHTHPMGHNPPNFNFKMKLTVAHPFSLFLDALRTASVYIHLYLSKKPSKIGPSKLSKKGPKKPTLLPKKFDGTAQVPKSLKWRWKEKLCKSCRVVPLYWSFRAWEEIAGMVWNWFIVPGYQFVIYFWYGLLAFICISSFSSSFAFFNCSLTLFSVWFSRKFFISLFFSATKQQSQQKKNEEEEEDFQNGQWLDLWMVFF